MANLVLNATFKRYDAVGGGFDTIHFATVAGQVSENATRKWLTATQQTNIETYLVPSTFNQASRLVQLNASGKIPGNLIDANFTDYLRRDGSAGLTGSLNASNNNINAVKELLFYEGHGIRGIADGALRFQVGIGSYSYIDMESSYMHLNGKRILGVNDPINGTDVTNKQYVDQLTAQGTKVIESVKAANPDAQTNVTTSGLGQIDGYQLVAGDRVLVWNQTTQSKNGIYLAATTTWTKVPTDSVPGALVSVTKGISKKGHQYVAKKGVAGSDITWFEYYIYDDYTPGQGININGMVISVPNLGITNAMLANHTINDSKLAHIILPSQVEQNEWQDVFDTTVAGGLRDTHLTNLYSAIRLLRGTSTYNTDNTQTIAGAYTVANQRNRTFLGTVAVPTPPPGDPFKEGDIYIQYVA